MDDRVLKPLLTRREVAEVLGVSVQTVGRIIGRGELKSVRIGERFWRIPAESLESYVEAQKKGGVR